MYTHKQVQLVDSEGVGGGVSKCSPPADFKPPATARKHQCSQDEGLYIYIYKYVCVCVSRSCLAQTVLTCMEYWSCIPTNKSNW